MGGGAGSELVIRLAEQAGRRTAARALAQHLGADELFVFVVDEELGGALVPAPGFAQTHPGGPGWRDLLGRARAPGEHRGTVWFPTRDTSTAAVARASARLALVFVGGEIAPGALAFIDAVAPLLAAIFAAEHAAVVAEGRLRLANEAADEASALAVALDRARTDLERTLKRLEEQAKSLEEARQAAESATRVKDEFLAMLGHELRNPLAPIVTALEILRLRGETSAELDIVGRQVAHLTRLVDDLLDISRITQGKIDLSLETVEVATLVTRAIEIASPLLESKGQHVIVDVPTTGLWIGADPARFAQIVSNLLTNAGRYSPEGSRIEIRASRAGETVRLSVRDEGIGIDPQMLEAVFTRFVQERSSARIGEGGLGLGLAIVRSLVRLHGGHVFAESRGQGHGSTFVVEVPAPAAPRSTSEAGRRHASIASRPRRVLVVDDNEDAAFLVAHGLRRLGHVAETAADGPTALEAVESFSPEVAVIDIGLPVMDGYEVARRLRVRDDGSSLHLIALTGYGQASDRRRALDAGFDQHLVKPVALGELQAEIERGR